MKKYLLAMITYGIVTGAMAAGTYDGIYASTEAPNSYISVHTNSNRLIATTYDILPASGVMFNSVIGSVMPRQVNTWQLLNGTINGNVADLSGQLMFNECNVRLTANFDANGLNVYITGSSSSGAGSSSTMNCQALVSPAPLRFNRIF